MNSPWSSSVVCRLIRAKAWVRNPGQSLKRNMKNISSATFS